MIGAQQASNFTGLASKTRQGQDINKAPEKNVVSHLNMRIVFQTLQLFKKILLQNEVHALKNNFICPLPWVSLSIGVNNKRRLCCHETLPEIPLTQGDIEQIKLLMNNQAIPLACKKCASLEAENIPSPRHQYLQEFTKLDELQYLDLVINNNCNLACVMCSPSYSSKLNDLYRETSPHDVRAPWKLDLEQLKTLNLSRIKIINIIGGEPLLSKDAYLFLKDHLQKFKLKKLRIISNFTHLPDHWRDIFSLVDNIELIASIDATDKVYEFIRYGASFNQVKEVLIKLKSWNLSNLFLRQHVVLMALNFPYLHDILAFHEEFFSNSSHRLPILIEISSPQVLHPRVLPTPQWEEAKTNAIAAVRELQKKYGERSEFSDFLKLIDKMEKIDLKHLYIDYKIYLQKIKKFHP